VRLCLGRCARRARRRRCARRGALRDTAARRLARCAPTARPLRLSRAAPAPLLWPVPRQQARPRWQWHGTRFCALGTAPRRGTVTAARAVCLMRQMRPCTRRCGSVSPFVDTPLSKALSFALLTSLLLLQPRASTRRRASWRRRRRWARLRCAATRRQRRRRQPLRPRRSQPRRQQRSRRHLPRDCSRSWCAPLATARCTRAAFPASLHTSQQAPGTHAALTPPLPLPIAGGAVHARATHRLAGRRGLAGRACTAAGDAARRCELAPCCCSARGRRSAC
jgi:hypothetical protein